MAKSKVVVVEKVESDVVQRHWIALGFGLATVMCSALPVQVWHVTVPSGFFQAVWGVALVGACALVLLFLAGFLWSVREAGRAVRGVD